MRWPTNRNRLVNVILNVPSLDPTILAGRPEFPTFRIESDRVDLPGMTLDGGIQVPGIGIPDTNRVIGSGGCCQVLSVR